MPARFADEDEVVAAGEVLALVEAGEDLSDLGDHRDGSTMAGLRGHDLAV